VSSPKYNEICTVISKLKSNKAGGADNIPPELIIKKKKGGGGGGGTWKQELYKLILKIWDKEQFPIQLNMSNIQ
jgi:hypothetical protein